MKRLLPLLLALLLCVCTLTPATVHGLPETDFPIPFSQEALLSALYEADITTLRQAIHTGLVTCEELTAYYLERIETYDKPFNCFITICDDALEVARQRDEQLAQGNAEGLLFGIPIVIKDNMDLAGYLTTNGHKKSESSTAKSDAYVVSRLLEEGAVIIAKANMSTDAQDARISYSQAVGHTRNAYNTLLASGGSSGGSAVATSLNFAAASLGTDTNSSLRIPAVLNGCVSLRPTFDLISRDGIKRLNSTRDVPGAITRSVRDLAIMMDVLTDHEFNYTQNLNSNRLEGLRIGVLKQLVRRTNDDADPEVLAAFDNAVEELRQCGAEVVEVSMSKLFTLSDPTFNSNKQSLKDALYKEFLNVLEKNELDAVVYPTYSSTPLRSGKDENGTSWNAWDQPFLNNCRTLAPSAGIPEVSVVIGYHSLGAGIGMEITAPKHQEQLLLDIAYAYTLRFDHRIPPTGAPDAYAEANAGTLQSLIQAYHSAADAATAPTTEPPTEPPTEPATQPPASLPATTPAEPHITDPTVPQPAHPAPEPPSLHLFWVIPLVCAILAVAILLILRFYNIRRAKMLRKKKRKQRRAAQESDPV